MTEQIDKTRRYPGDTKDMIKFLLKLAASIVLLFASLNYLLEKEHELLEKEHERTEISLGEYINLNSTLETANQEFHESFNQFYSDRRITYDEYDTLMVIWRKDLKADIDEAEKIARDAVRAALDEHARVEP